LFAEAVAVGVQARGGPTAADWSRVKTSLERGLGVEDGLAVGSRWIEPLARQALGDALLTRSRVGADANTWPRLAVIAERGDAQLPEGYVEEAREQVGALEIRFGRAAAAFAVLGRLEVALPEARALVDVGGQELPCAWGAHGLVAGNLGSGPAWPSERFACSGASVARSFVTDLDYRAHDAIFVEVPGDGRTVVVRFPPRPAGTAIRGGFGLYVEAERDGRGAPVYLEWRSEGRNLGSLVHHDGEGWKRFELATGASPGALVPLELRLRSPGGHRRLVGVSAAIVEARQ
jgi:hypothetical protein